MKSERGKAYKAAGVNLDAADTLVSRLKSLTASTHIKGVLSDIGGFGGLFKPDLGDLEEPVLVASTDGVGTKLKLASAWSAYDTIGIDLVAMSANDILVQGALPLFFLDYYACGVLDVARAQQVVAGVAAGCKEAGCALLGGETAEMPDVYQGEDFDLAGFCVGLVDNTKIVDGAGISVGDVIIGLGSTGLHSNGYSLVRKLVAEAGLAPEDKFPGSQRSVKEVLLAPTAIYVKTVRNVMRDFTVKGMVHITGGGFYDNIPRILPKVVEARLRFGSWPVPSVFHWLKEQGGLHWGEMLQIFNCGLGYLLVVPQDQEEDVRSRLDALKQPAWTIGRIERRKDAGGDQVVFEHLP
ncbi:phosphoribosylformylglycinamidine cyclo-ligase [Megalodesulfovibrio paquesii]